MSQENTEQSRDSVIVRTSIIGIVANVFLATFKAIVGVLSNSIAISSSGKRHTKWISSALESSTPAIGITPYLLQASKNAGQFFALLWSVSAAILIPLSAHIPAILFGVISSSPQGDRQE